MINCGVIILAAGKGTRMVSDLPKALHPIAGKSMLQHLLDTASSLHSQSNIVVYGFAGERLRRDICADVLWVEQTEQLGTGHAVLQTLPHLDNECTYLILVGDAPLIQSQTLHALLKAAHQTGIALLTVKVSNPNGYGRVLRDAEGRIIQIIEEKDTSQEQKKINEINSGIFAVSGELLKSLLPKINKNNAQQEYYLTDIVELANQHGFMVHGHEIDDEDEVMGCNTRQQLAKLERLYQRRQANALLNQGVSVFDPDRIDIRGTLTVGKNVEIDINCLFIGQVHLGDNVRVGSHCIIRETNIGCDSIIHPYSLIEEATLLSAVQVGPFARIRPQTQMANRSKAGNFVELKNAQLGEDCKVSHLSYIGDALLGKSVNIGAGTITCNYDGKHKYQTQIQEGAFIGSNTALIAPVTIGKNATVGAGSVITKSVAEDQLAIARGRQVNITNWQND